MTNNQADALKPCPDLGQRFVSKIIEAAQNSALGLGDAEKSISLALYEQPYTWETIALVLVSAYTAKYDLVSLMAAAMEHAWNTRAPEPEGLPANLTEHPIFTLAADQVDLTPSQSAAIDAVLEEQLRPTAGSGEGEASSARVAKEEAFILLAGVASDLAESLDANLHASLVARITPLIIATSAAEQALREAREMRSVQEAELTKALAAYEEQVIGLEAKLAAAEQAKAQAEQELQTYRQNTDFRIKLTEQERDRAQSDFESVLLQRYAANKRWLKSEAEKDQAEQRAQAAEAELSNAQRARGVKLASVGVIVAERDQLTRELAEAREQAANYATNCATWKLRAIKVEEALRAAASAIRARLSGLPYSLRQVECELDQLTREGKA